jgi:uncharacterized protein (DUF1015 family)
MSLQNSAHIYGPFAALRPAAEHAAEVAAPPYDVMTTDEALDLATGKPWSFLHVSRPEIDMPKGTDVHDPAVYAKGAQNLRRMTNAGVLVQDATPSYYVYRMTSGSQKKTGIAATASIDDYLSNRVRRHELTRPDKETDRVNHMVALNAQTGPVLAVHRADPIIATIADRACQDAPMLRADVAGTSHEVWPISGSADVSKLTTAFDRMEAVYIADGHHRSAAAARVAAGRPEQGPHKRFLVVSFPDDEVTILDYNRVIRDLGGLSSVAFLTALSDRFEVNPAPAPVQPTTRGLFGMYLPGQWYRLQLRGGVPKNTPLLDRLDIELLSHHLLEPVLGIGDSRTDTRIDFVGGARGLEGLSARVDSGEMAVAFSLWPTQLQDLMAIADANQIMPPKSTWFEPKLADGLLIHVLSPINS